MKFLITAQILFLIILSTLSMDVLAAESRNDRQASRPGQAGNQVERRERGDAAARSAQAKIRSLSKNIQKLKREVVSLNKDLRIMEEKILFPSNTKYTVFVSLSSGQFFILESIKLKIDDRLVASHLYSDPTRA